MRKFVCLILSIILSSNFIIGQSTFHSLDEVWAYAVANNKDNTLYQLQVEKSIKDNKTSESYLFPKLSLGISGQRNSAIPETPIPGEIFGRPGETVFVQFGQPFNYSRGINITKTFLDWQSRFQAKIAKSNIGLAEAEKELFEQNLKEQIAQLYYAILTTRSAINLSLKNLSIADSILWLTAIRYEQNLIDNMILNSAKINKNEALDRLQQNKQFLFEQETSLKILLGLAQQDTFILSEQIKLNSEVTLETISANELRLKIYRIQAERSRFVTKQALGHFSPRIDFYSYYGGIQYQEEFGISTNTNDWLPSRYFGLNLVFPLFTGFASKNQYQSAKISEEISQLNLHDALRVSSLNDNILFNNYITSMRSVQTSEQSLLLADENVRLAHSKYSEGLISLDNYLSVYDDYLAVENQFFNRLSDYLINKAIIQSRNK